MTAVIFLNRYFYPDHSATSQMLTDLAFELVRTGRDVHVITSRQVYDDPGARLPTNETVRGVQVHRVWTSRFGRGRLLGRAVDYLSFYVSATMCLAWRVRRGYWVVAKTDPPLLSIPAAVVARIRGANFVNWLQDLFPEVAYRLRVAGIGIVGPALRRLRNLSLHLAHCNVAIGERMAERVRNEGISGERVRVIHNWSDGSKIRPVPPRHNALRMRWGLHDRLVVGYSGNMGRAHEFETILAAAERLTVDDRIVFVFIGSGARREWLAAESRKRGLTNVMFQPYQPRERLTHSLSVPDVHLVTLYPALEGLIVPSKFYGIAAAGRAVIYIGDPEGEVPRLLRDGECGYTIMPDDVDSLVAWLARFAADPAEIVRLGGNARRLFDTRFDQPIAMRYWSELLRQPDTLAARVRPANGRH